MSSTNIARIVCIGDRYTGTRRHVSQWFPVANLSCALRCISRFVETVEVDYSVYYRDGWDRAARISSMSIKPSYLQRGGLREDLHFVAHNRTQGMYMLKALQACGLNIGVAQ